MRIKVERICEEIQGHLRDCEWVECVSVGEAASLDPLDPYFSIALTVYRRGELPPPDARRSLYGSPDAFESSSFQEKDRFLLSELPVHVEYRSVEGVDRLLRGGTDVLWILRETGTLPFYLIQTSRILFSRSGWMEKARARLESLPDTVWAALREAFQSRMEHYLTDMGASVLKSDDYFHNVARTGFLRYVSSAIFAANRAFEPPHRYVSERIMRLPLLPDDFSGRWETMLRHEGEITPSRRYEVAKLIAKSLFEMES